jgi:K+-sensing histidine kinase KdpD
MTSALTTQMSTQSPSELSREDVLHAIAHEIRQPLGAIESLAYYLSLTLPRDVKNESRHREQLTRIQQLVEQSNWILSNGLGLADSREASPEVMDMEELITQAISARISSLDPPVICDLAPGLPLVRLDPGFGRRLIENILALFRQLATDAHPARIQTATGAEGVELEVSTTAPGYRSIASLPPGSALSLDCAQRIAAMHGGSLTHSIDPVSGIRVQVMLP